MNMDKLWINNLSQRIGSMLLLSQVVCVCSYLLASSGFGFIPTCKFLALSLYINIFKNIYCAINNPLIIKKCYKIVLENIIL